MQSKSNLTGVTSTSDIQIQKAISHLLIVKTGATLIDNETINVALQDSQGNQNKVMTLTKIRDIAVISQFTNGYLLVESKPDGKVKSAYMLELTDGYALDLTDNNYLTVDLDKLDPAATYDVYGIENPVIAQSYLSYNTTVIAGSEPQQKTYQVTPTAQSLAIRNNGSLAKLRLYTADGREVSYLPEELSALGREINDVTQSADKIVEGDTINQTLMGGASEFFYYPLDGFKGFEITTTGTADLTFVMVDTKSL